MKKIISIYDFFVLYQTNDNLLILDVRDNINFLQYHIPKSINISKNDILHNNCLLDYHKRYYVIDYNDEWANTVCDYLEQLGYDVICVYGGIKRWMGKLIN